MPLGDDFDGSIGHFDGGLIVTGGSAPFLSELPMGERVASFSFMVGRAG
jgi:hypothetical protein